MPVPQENLLLVEQASCLLLKEVQDLSSIEQAANLCHQKSIDLSIEV
jgi:hypothetical protein